MLRSHFVVIIVVLSGCAGEPAVTPPEARVEDVTVLVSSASERLSRPADLALDEDGNVYVLDGQLSQILVFSPAGALVETIGREGSGPGEFKRPRSLAVTRDTIRVVDMGNGILQTLARDSDFQQHTPLPVGANLSPIAVTKDGRLLGGTLGAHGVLALYHDAAGNEVRGIGRPPASAAVMMNFVEMKRDIIAGTLPAMWQNAVMPVFALHDEMWLVFMSQGLVQRYDSVGSLLVSVPYEAPEMEAIWSGCVARNRETLHNQRTICVPTYVVDAAVHDQVLWILLFAQDDDPAVMLGFAQDGTVIQRVVFTQAKGAYQFVLDRRRARIVFAIRSDASLVTSSFPAEP